MLDNAKISVRQFTILVFMWTVGATVLIIPSGMAAEAKQDGWIASIVGVLIGFGLVCFYNYVARIQHNRSLAKMNEDMFGTWLGKLVTLSFVIFAMITVCTLVWVFGNFLATMIIPRTPMPYINLLFLGIVIIAVRYGIEVIGRSAEIFFPWVIGLFCFMVFAISPQIEWQNLQPVLHTPLSAIFKAGFLFASVASINFIVLHSFYPTAVQQPQKARIAVWRGFGLGGMMMILLTFLALSVLGVDLTSRHLFPSYILAKKINIGEFLKRIESIMAAIWFFTIFYKTTLYYYSAVVALAETFRIKDYRFLVLPMGLIMLVISINVYPNTSYFLNWDGNIWPFYVSTYGLLLPIIWIVLHFVKRNKT
ncbi:GerAB/ArcD/ProY family transporter [Marinicrinis sediminis]|uniref:Endospore germination permease n=1 Tax=Marinicrinis sediminis TaxID=1652465 RepID=A0ABW5REL9_9BACL